VAFTAADLTTVEDAIRDVTAGKRVVSITLSDRIERRTDVTLGELIKLRGPDPGRDRGRRDRRY
jgi:hypothetical protein